MSKKSNGFDLRKHCYALVLYPDSMVKNWRALLSSLMLPMCLSPLHDSDINANGEPKKPHYHLFVDFGQNKKSWEQVNDIFSVLGDGAVLAPIRYDKGFPACDSWIISKRGCIRYWVHADNPEKAQYSTSDVVCFGGFDFWKVYNASSCKYDTIRSIIGFCKDNNIESFATLFEYCMEYNETWFMTLCDSGVYLVKEYLKSRSWERDKNIKANYLDKSVVKEIK